MNTMLFCSFAYFYKGCPSFAISKGFFFGLENNGQFAFVMPLHESDADFFFAIIMRGN